MSKTVDVLKENGFGTIENYAASADYQTQSLARTFLLAWQEAHGTQGGSASVLRSSDTIAILIEDTLTKAELVLAEQADGQVILQRYIETVFEQLEAELLGSVEAVSGQRVIQKCVSVSLKCGWIVCLFRLDRSQPSNGS